MYLFIYDIGMEPAATLAALRRSTLDHQVFFYLGIVDYAAEYLILFSSSRV